MSSDKIPSEHTPIKVLGITSIARAKPFVYIVNIHSNDVSVIDTATDTTINPSLHVEREPYGVAVSSDGEKAYVTNTCSRSISIIDTTKNSVTTTKGLWYCPLGVAVSPNGTKLYVSNFEYNGVSIENTNSIGDNLRAVEIGENRGGDGYHPWGVAFTPDGKRVYAANEDGNKVYVIDIETNKVIATIPVGKGPRGVAVSPDGTDVYVASLYDNVSVINTATNIVRASIPVGSSSFGVAVSPDGTKLYVTNHDNNMVSVVNTTTNTVTATVPVGSHPLGVAVNPAGTKVYVANNESNTVSVIDTKTNNVTATVPVGKSPIIFGQAIVPAQKTFYNTNVTSTNYQYSGWGQYPLVNLHLDLFTLKYVPLFSNSDPIFKSHANKLVNVVLDSSDNHTLKIGDKLDLGQGYSLQAKQVDIDDKKVWLEFTKDGEYVDDQVISVDTGSDKNWTCTLDDLQGVNNVPVLKVHVNQIFQVVDDYIAQIDGIWLIDYKNVKTLNVGDVSRYSSKFGFVKICTLTKIIGGINAFYFGGLVYEVSFLDRPHFLNQSELWL